MKIKTTIVYRDNWENSHIPKPRLGSKWSLFICKRALRKTLQKIELRNMHIKNTIIFLPLKIAYIDEIAKGSKFDISSNLRSKSSL